MKVLCLPTSDPMRPIYIMPHAITSFQAVVEGDGSVSLDTTCLGTIDGEEYHVLVGAQALAEMIRKP